MFRFLETRLVLADKNVLLGTIDESDLILGKFDIVNDFILINCWFSHDVTKI